MSKNIFGKEYKFHSTSEPTILSEEGARLEEMRNDTIRDEYDSLVVDYYAKYDLSDSRIWKCVGTYDDKTKEIGERTAFGISCPVYQYRTWKIYVAKTTGKIVHQCKVQEYCALDDMI